MGNLFTLWLTKGLAFISRTFNFGAGSTWPGHVLLKLNPAAPQYLSRQFTFGSILITGTNGKTTTTKITKTLLDTHGLVSVVNNAGANLLNGITSALISSTSLSGSLKAAIGLFEVDEGAFPHALKELSPRLVVFLNLFRDQLDRYGEVEAIAESWRTALSGLGKETTVILNADDPTVASLARGLRTQCLFFGLANPALYQTAPQHARDALFCPLCGTRLSFSGIYFSHLGDWWCPGCDNRRPAVDISSLDFTQPLPGLYNYYNAAAALLVARVLGFDHAKSLKALANVSPAFGRLEEFRLGETPVLILLSKNPTGFNEALRTLGDLSKDKGVVWLALNDKIPDGRDISWIWDVDFEPLRERLRHVIVSGRRAEDLALRLKYAGIKEKKLRVTPDFKQALSFGLSALSPGERLYILPTYSAMLEIRKLLTGRSIL